MEDQSEVYRQFESFDFNNEDFQNGVLNLYDSVLDSLNQDRDGKISEIITEIPGDQKDRLSIQAKSFYFCQQTGNIFNIEDYYEWKAQQSSQPAIEEVKANAMEEEQEVNEEPEYSSNYQNIVEKIIKGEEISGIRQIPDTVLEGKSSEAKADLRKKPWEVKKEQEQEKEDQEELEKEQELNELTTE